MKSVLGISTLLFLLTCIESMAGGNVFRMHRRNSALTQPSSQLRSNISLFQGEQPILRRIDMQVAASNLGLLPSILGLRIDLTSKDPRDLHIVVVADKLALLEDTDKGLLLHIGRDYSNPEKKIETFHKFQEAINSVKEGLSETTSVKISENAADAENKLNGNYQSVIELGIFY